MAFDRAQRHNLERAKQERKKAAAAKRAAQSKPEPKARLRDTLRKARHHWVDRVLAGLREGPGLLHELRERENSLGDDREAQKDMRGALELALGKMRVFTGHEEEAAGEDEDFE